jgi:hypothetical protein
MMKVRLARTTQTVVNNWPASAAQASAAAIRIQIGDARLMLTVAILRRAIAAFATPNVVSAATKTGAALFQVIVDIRQCASSLVEGSAAAIIWIGPARNLKNVVTVQNAYESSSRSRLHVL